MYYMSNKPAMQGYIRKALRGLTPFEVVKRTVAPTLRVGFATRSF